MSAEVTPILQLANAIDEQREMVGAMVAGFKADGFTDEQARVLVTGLFAALIKKPPEEGA